MARKQLVGVAVDTARVGDVAEGKVVFYRQRVQAAVKPRVGGQHLEFRAKNETAVVQPAIVQRLDPHAVARQKQGLLVAVPQGKGKHAAQPVQARLAPRAPGVHDHFGIAARPEVIAQGLKLRHQRAVVVDLAVEDDTHAAIFAEQGLLARDQIDNRQPPVPQGQARLQVDITLVGATVELHIIDMCDQFTRKMARTLCIEKPGYAAHVQSRPRVCLSAAASASPCVSR